MNSLNERALLVNLVIHMWTNQRSDDRAVRAVEEKYQLQAGADKYVKNLLEPGTLSTIKLRASRLRNAHYRYTLPWQDDGVRILPSVMFLEYQQEMRLLKDDFERSVTDLLKGYDAYKLNAKIRMKELYDESEYPDSDELRRKFGVETNFLPFPDAGDFRIQGEAGEAFEQLKKDAQTSYERATRDAVRTFLSGLYDSLASWGIKLSYLNQRSLDALHAQLDLLPKMNLLEDDRITQMRELMKTALSNYTAEALRNDAEARMAISSTMSHCCGLIREITK